MFPLEISTMVDVFGGGFNVGVNSTASKIIYNDQVTPLVELMEYFYNHTGTEIVEYIHRTIKDYNLTKTDKDSFNEFRSEYNNSEIRNPLDLYVLSCYSFNHQLRFNNNGEYNSSHGTNRSSFTRNMERNLIRFIRRLHTLNVVFCNKDFNNLDYTTLPMDSFVYLDPPYLNSTGNYNDGNRGFKNWTIREEKQLYNLLYKLDDYNIHYGLSNTVENNGVNNNFLIDYIQNSNCTVYEINSDYRNSNYQKKDKTKNKEVYLTNIE